MGGSLPNSEAANSPPPPGPMDAACAVASAGWAAENIVCAVAGGWARDVRAGVEPAATVPLRLLGPGAVGRPVEAPGADTAADGADGPAES